MSDRFTDSFLDELRAAVSITDVVGQHVQWEKGRNTGDDRWCCCPLHGESTPSFHANDRDGYWKCHGCGEGGDQFKFVMLHDSVDFPDAVARVASIAGIALPEGTGGGKPSRPPEQPRKTKVQPQPSAETGKRETVKAYDYTDRDGNLIYQVRRIQIRMPDGSWAKAKDGKSTWKDFRQCRPSGLPDGSWVWGLGEGEYIRPAAGKDWSPWDRKKADKWPEHEARFFPAVDHTIYRHPAVEIAIDEGKIVMITEGEKDADTAVDLGFCGTTNSSGSKHWTEVHAACFRDADVVICLDNDAAGDRADKLAKSMKGIARRIRVLNFADHVPGFDHKGDITDWVEKFGGTTEALKNITQNIPDWRPKAPKGFGGTSFNQVAGSPITYDWLIKGLVERNGVFIFAGEKQAGKSFAVMDMGMKIARGLQYGDRITRRGIVIHVACEDGRGVKMRAEGYRQANGIEPDVDVPYVIMDREFSLMSDDVIERFIATVKEWEEFYGLPVELIIIDTLSVATEGLNEIDGAEVGKVLARVNRLKDDTGAAVCLVHHMNASGGRVRGHTSIEANVSQVFEIRPLMTMPQNRRETPQPILDGDGRHIRQIILTKNKNGLNMLKWRVVLRVVDLGFDADGDKITTCVVDRPAKANRSDDTSEDTGKLSPDQKLVYDALVSAHTDEGTDMPSGSAAPPQIKRCAPMPAFVGRVRKSMTFSASEEEIEKRNTELTAFLKRTTTSLINAGYMGRDNDLKIVWWTGRSDRPVKREAKPIDPPGTGISEEVKREIAETGAPF